MNFEELAKNKKNVSGESIEYIKSIIKTNKLNKVLEIGTYNGYSAIHLSTVAKSVTTIEIQEESIQEAKANLNKYSINNVKIIHGDAIEVLKNLNEKFDVIFIDAMKRQYKEYLILALKLIDKGYIFADNTISHKEKMKDFFDYLESSKLNWKELGIGKGLVMIKI